MHDNAVAALAIFCIFGLPVAAWIVVRAMRFVERMEMIKRGIVPPPDGAFGRGRAYREWARQQQQQGPWAGAPWQQPGVTPPPVPPPVAASYGDDDAQTQLYKGIRLALIGFAILIGLSFIGGTPLTAEFHGGPWLLGGLIPMFVGVAQIIIALLSGAQLPNVQSRPTFVPPPGAGPPPPGSPPPGPTTVSGPWEQPGRRFEELSKPVQPPDVR